MFLAGFRAKIGTKSLPDGDTERETTGVNQTRPGQAEAFGQSAQEKR